MTERSEKGLTNRRPVPILVTGMPRSGTTWLARLLALSNGTSMPGREPMNARGQQYALAGSLSGWTRLLTPTVHQRRALWLAYRGLTPRTYSRYGVRQWAAPLPSTRLIVKDPFALLSIPAVTAATGARTVLVYRHPGAVLASYRRMGWSPKLDEFRPILDAAREAGVRNVTPLPQPGEASEAGLFASVWAALHDVALADVVELDSIVVSHSELAAGGARAGQVLAARLGLTWTDAMQAEMSRESGTTSALALHNLDRAPTEVAESWRRMLSEEDTAECEERSERTRQALAARALRLTC